MDHGPVPTRPRSHGRFGYFLVPAALLGLVALSACEEPERPGAEAEPELLPQAEAFRVPPAVAPDGEPERPDTLRFGDMSDALHAVFLHGARARDSEMGHSAYRPELHEDFMEAQVHVWLELVQALTERFFDGSAVRPRAELEDGRWRASGDPQLRDYVWGGYIYHMHHREGWFEHHDFGDAITLEPLGILTGISRHLYSGFHEDGRFRARPGEGEVTPESMMDGLAAAHAPAYAWVRWSKPDGADDMGGLEEGRLVGWLGRGPDALVAEGREMADALDEAWREEVDAYDFGSMEWDLRTVGSLLRGHKALYEVLYIFGDEADQERAETLFRRAATVLERTLPLAEEWGLPARVSFGPEGIEAASDEVDTAAHWDFVAHLTAGFSFDREREGTSRMLQRHRPDLAEELAEFVDVQIAGALDHQMPDGILASRLDLETGEVTDPDHRIEAISRFMAGAGEGYGGSHRFAPAEEWDEAGEEAEEATRELYETLLRHGNFVVEVFLGVE